VHQGGVGTMAQALRAGVPMLVGTIRSGDNAARVVLGKYCRFREKVIAATER